jgi:hypothetical protein
MCLKCITQTLEIGEEISQSLLDKQPRLGLLIPKASMSDVAGTFSSNDPGCMEVIMLLLHWFQRLREWPIITS